MQSVRFLREGFKHYMVVPCNDRIDTGYKSRMVQHCPIPYYSQYEIREFNGKQVLYYRLKYHTTVKTVMDHLPFTLSQVKNMIISIIGVIEVTEDYLLYFDAIVWRTDRVFIDVNTGKLDFCYNPNFGQDNGNYKDFLSEIMEQVSKKNHEAWELFSEFYNLVTNPECLVEQLVQYRKDRLGREDDIYIDEPRKKSTSQEIFETVSGKLIKEEYTETFTVRDEGFFIRALKFIIVAMAIVNIALIIFLLCNVLTYTAIKYLVIGIGIMAAALILYLRMSEDDSVDEIMQSYLESLPEYGEDSPWSKNETTLLQEGTIEEKPSILCLVSVIKDRNPTIYVHEKSVVLGCMEENCDYVLKVDGVSRMHARLVRKEDGLYMSDLNSTNGTYLNGKLIESGKDYQLKEGDVVSIVRNEFFVVPEN